MELVIDLIKNYWVQTIFLGGVIRSFYKMEMIRIDAERCLLRNDVLSIYDKCKDSKKITRYQLESIKHSSELYFKLKGNSFIEDIVARVEKFELVDWYSNCFVFFDGDWSFIIDE